MGFLKNVKAAMAQGMSGAGPTPEQLATLTPEQRAAYDAQMAQVAQAQAELENRRRELEEHDAAMAGVRGEWDQRMQELSAARESLAALQKQLESELQKVVTQKTELLPNVSAGTAAESAAKQSLEKFQKMCRDAKRRAIGA